MSLKNEQNLPQVLLMDLSVTKLEMSFRTGSWQNRPNRLFLHGENLSDLLCASIARFEAMTKVIIVKTPPQRAPAEVFIDGESHSLFSVDSSKPYSMQPDFLEIQVWRYCADKPDILFLDDPLAKQNRSKRNSPLWIEKSGFKQRTPFVTIMSEKSLRVQELYMVGFLKTGSTLYFAPHVNFPIPSSRVKANAQASQQQNQKQQPKRPQPQKQQGVIIVVEPQTTSSPLSPPQMPQSPLQPPQPAQSPPPISAAKSTTAARTPPHHTLVMKSSPPWSPASGITSESKRRKIAEEPSSESEPQLQIEGEQVDEEEEVKQEDGRTFDWDMMFNEFRKGDTGNYKLLEDTINEIEAKLDIVQPSEYRFRQRNELLDWMDGLVTLGVYPNKSAVVSQLLAPLAKEPWFFGPLHREVSRQFLSHALHLDTSNDIFLVRLSNSVGPCFSLDACYMDTKTDSPKHYSAHIVMSHSSSGQVQYSLDTAKDARPSTSRELRGVLAYMMAKTGWTSVTLPPATTTAGRRGSYPHLDVKPIFHVPQRNLIPQGNIPYVDGHVFGRLPAGV